MRTLVTLLIAALLIAIPAKGSGANPEQQTKSYYGSSSPHVPRDLRNPDPQRYADIDRSPRRLYWWNAAEIFAPAMEARRAATECGSRQRGTDQNCRTRSGRTAQGSKGSGSVHEKHWQLGSSDNMLRRATEDHLPQTALSVCALDQ